MTTMQEALEHLRCCEEKTEQARQSYFQDQNGTQHAREVVAELFWAETPMRDVLRLLRACLDALHEMRDADQKNQQHSEDLVDAECHLRNALIRITSDGVRRAQTSPTQVSWLTPELIEKVVKESGEEMLRFDKEYKERFKRRDREWMKLDLAIAQLQQPKRRRTRKPRRKPEK